MESLLLFWLLNVYFAVHFYLKFTFLITELLFSLFYMKLFFRVGVDNIPQENLC